VKGRHLRKRDGIKKKKKEGKLCGGCISAGGKTKREGIRRVSGVQKRGKKQMPGNLHINPMAQGQEKKGCAKEGETNALPARYRNHTRTERALTSAGKESGWEKAGMRGCLSDLPPEMTKDSADLEPDASHSTKAQGEF